MRDATLKPGWTRVSFGDVVKLNTDRFADPAAAGIERYMGLEHIEPEDLRIRRWGFVADGTTFTNCFRPGQVLFGKRRAYLRKVAVADFEGVCSSDIYVFESKDPDVLLPGLLPFLCQTEGFFQHAVGTSAGSLSPDPLLLPYEQDYRWLSQVYISVQPTTGTGGLIWHALGAKTIELIHENIHVYAVRDDLDEIVLDPDLLEAILGTPDPDAKTREIEFKLAQRLRRHMGNPRYRALSERLEALKERHEAGQLHSIEFLKQLLDLASDLLEVEKETPPEEDEDRGKAALTELFEEVRNPDTPIIVERLVGKIDEIVRFVRFPGWQSTSAGEREVRKALRKTLFDFKLHQDAELFEKAYSYVRQYY